MGGEVGRGEGSGVESVESVESVALQTPVVNSDTLKHPGNVMSIIIIYKCNNYNFIIH